MSSAQISPARILIADDDPQSVELLEAYLASTGHDVRTAADGEETLKAIQEWQPDVVLLDVMMPKISGFQVCKRLREERGRQVGVLMITALDEPSDVDRALDVGADDFLTKPINKSDLLGRIRACLAVRHIASDIERALAYIEAVQREGK
jgi:DNA-binding response OmpR family regulator